MSNDTSNPQYVASSDSSKDAPAHGDYAVGYRRPPVATRFKPGKSGNPRGRPKGRKHFGVALQEALDRQFEVSDEKGGKRNVAAQDVIMRGLVSDAARRDRAALRQLIQLLHYIDGGKPPDDAQRRAAELAGAKESLRAKLEALAARIGNMQGEGNSGQT